MCCIMDEFLRTKNNKGAKNGVSILPPYLIFVTKFTCGEKSVMWRNFRFLYMANGDKSEKCSGIYDFRCGEL